MNIPPVTFHSSRGSELPVPTLCIEPHLPQSFIPRSKRFGKCPPNGLTKEMINRAFARSTGPLHKPATSLCDSNDFNTSFRTVASKAVSVECGYGSSPKRTTSSPRIVSRGRVTPGTRKPSYPRSSRLASLALEASIPRLDVDDEHGAVEAVNDTLSNQKLKGIEDHKVRLAELRPTRRRVKFNHRTHYLDVDGTVLPRIQALTLEDLSNHGYGELYTVDQGPATTPPLPLNSIQTTMPIDVDNKDVIRKLESELRCSIRKLERLDELIETDRMTADAIDGENQEIRRKLISHACLSRGLFKVHSSKHLATAIADLERQLQDLNAELRVLC